MEKLNFHIITLGNARSQFVDVIRAGVNAQTALTQYKHFITTFELVSEALREQSESAKNEGEFEFLERVRDVAMSMYDEVRMHFEYYGLPDDEKHKLPTVVVYSA